MLGGQGRVVWCVSIVSFVGDMEVPRVKANFYGNKHTQQNVKNKKNTQQSEFNPISYPMSVGKFDGNILSHLSGQS